MKRPLLWLLAIGLLADVQTAAAQPAKTTPRIGFLSANSAAAMTARVQAFQQGLRDLRYVEGDNIIVEYRYADGQPDRLKALAAELVRLNVGIIVTEGPTATRVAKHATSAIPIVMGQDPDPVATGFVASLSRPGGNITGLTSLRTDLSAKRLELLKRTLPSLATVAVIGTAATPGTREALQQTEAAAAALRLKLHYVDVVSAAGIAPAFRTAAEARPDAVIVLASPFLLSNRSQVAELATKNRLPVMYYTQDFVQDGGLMSYGVSVTDLFRRSATYVDKILAGAKAAELPIEQPAKFELVINLKAAKQLGLAIPLPVLYQADRLIE